MTKKKNKVKPTAKPKYNIEDLKGGLIAVHLPEPVSFIIAMKYLNRSGEHFPLGYRAPDYTAWKKYREETCVMFDMGTGCIESFSRLHCDANSYTIITLEDLEGLEPTAEEEKQYVTQADIERSIKNSKRVFVVDLEQEKEVIIKYKDKEKVITRDDFEEEEDNQKWGMTHLLDEIKEDRGDRGDVVYGKDLGYAKGNNVHITSTEPIPNYESFLIKEGSDIWAFKMVLEGKKVFNAKLPRYKYLGFTKDKILLWRCVYNDYSEGIGEVPKDGWEIYKEEEPKKTMLFEEMLELKKNCKFLFSDSELEMVHERKDGEILWRFNSKPHKFSLSDIAKHVGWKVEIIGDYL